MVAVYRCPRCDGIAFTLSPDHRWVTCNGCALEIDLGTAEVQPIIVRGYSDDEER
jgi:hypothetical protein